MKRFVIAGVPSPVVKVTKDSDLFQVAPTDPDFGKYAVLEARVNVESLRNIHTDGDEDTDDISRAPNTGISLEPNPRMQNLKTDVAEAIRDSLLERDGQFHRKNRGILLTVEEFNYDNKSGELSWVEEDPKIHGCLDGGHTLRIIDQYVGSAEWSAAVGNGKASSVHPQFVSLQIVKGIPDSQIPEVAGARNTSVNVEDFALGELGEKFEFIKPHLKKAHLFDLVAFKQNEMRSSKKKVIDIVGVLQRLTILDNAEFGEDHKQPYHAYWSRAKTYDEFLQRVPNYQRLANRVGDALSLPEYVLLNYGEWYKKTAGKGNTGRGRFGATSECKDPSKPTPLHFLPIVKKDKGWPSKAGYQLKSDAIAMPIVAATRVILSADDDDAKWLEDPYDFLDLVGPSLVDSLNSAINNARGQTTTVLKSKEVWKNLYIQAKTLAYELGVIEVKKRSA